MEENRFAKLEAKHRRAERRARPVREKVEEVKGRLGYAFIAFVTFCFIFGPLVGPRAP